MTTQEWDIKIYHTLVHEGWKKKNPTKKHTGFEIFKKKTRRKMNGMQKSTCKYLTFTIYRHVARRAVTMAMIMGWGVEHAVIFGRGGGMPIDSSVGRH